MRLQDYPFLVPLDDFAARELGFRPTLSTIASDPAIREAALASLESCASGSGSARQSRDTVESVLSFYLALALSKAIGPSALEALVECYADSSYRRLHLEDEESLVAITRASGLELRSASLSLAWSISRKSRVKTRILRYAVPLPAYLKSTSGARDPRLKLVNQFLRDGLVYLDRERLLLLLRERFRKLILARAGEVDPADLPPELLEAARDSFEKGLRRRRGLRWDPGALPPCIKESFKAIARGDASDDAVYLTATFASALRLTASEMAEALGLEASDWRVRGLARLAAEASKLGFTVYTCQAARRRGLCPGSDECRASSPTREYFRRLKGKGALRRGTPSTS
ncbi:MAG: hypothetical protein GSR80_000135 [Desulfurococcales archaeon]|nr:hypothetical protein [Desulfurococcales archaeon]